jgi:predicted nucleic acid-binding protein
LNPSILVDTGPLVALLDRSDAEHDRCTSALANLRLPFATTWPVITEAAWLLRARSDHVVRLLQLVTEGHVDVFHLDAESTLWMASFINKYADQSPQLADASLVHLAERLDINSIFTLDKRDFSIYRTTAGHALDILPL